MWESKIAMQLYHSLAGFEICLSNSKSRGKRGCECVSDCDVTHHKVLYRLAYLLREIILYCLATLLFTVLKTIT